jgi:hypothetical protein
MSLIKVFKKFKYIMRKITNILGTWCYLLFDTSLYSTTSEWWYCNGKLPQECAMCYTLPHFAK